MSHFLFLSFSSIEKRLEFLLILRPNGLLIKTQDIYRDLGLFKEERVEKMEVLKILRCSVRLLLDVGVVLDHIRCFASPLLENLHPFSGYRHP
jgi:hypothetical protein